MFKTLFVSIVGGLVIWFVQDHFRDVPKAYFSISNPIEIPSSTGSTEYAQEISVVNRGRTNVKDVAVRVPLPITSYKLTRHSSLVKESLGADPKRFELIYPELPVEQRFTLLLRYSGSPISKNLFEISHASGVGVNQEDNNGNISWTWILVALWLGWLISSTTDIYRFKRESFSRWVDKATIYRNDKPWYISIKEWPEVQFEAIRKLLNTYEYSGIEESESYKLLRKNKPELLDDDRWATLTREAVALLLTRFSRDLNAFTSTEKLLDLSRIKKPELLSLEAWKEIQKSLSDRIGGNLLHENVSEKELIDILEGNSVLLNGLPEGVGNRIKKKAAEKYALLLLDRCQNSYHVQHGDDLHSARLDLLNESQRERLSKVASKFKRMFALPQNWSPSEIGRFVSGGKPQWMAEDEFNSLKEFAGKAKSLEEETTAIQVEKSKLTSSKNAVDLLILRVTAQLAAIDRVLLNPETIEKFEDYDQTFAPGNWSNLKKVAKMLRAEN